MTSQSEWIDLWRNALNPTRKVKQTEAMMRLKMEEGDRQAGAGKGGRMIRDAQPQQFDIEWRDAGLEPRVKPNPAYPEGIDVSGVAPGEIGCRVALPYPAKRIGSYLVRCRLCGYRLALTTAGRPDDPRSVSLPCKGMR